jgi:hypothetical protein
MVLAELRLGEHYTTRRQATNMGDSLIISNSIEIMQGPGGQQSQDPRCPGAIFQIGPGYDFGAPQTVTSIVASLITDGERPLGRRASNRLMTIPVQIWAPTRDILVAAREVLLTTVDQQEFDIAWTRENGPTAIIKAFRQQPPQPAYDIKAERGCIQVITLMIPALPFLRSNTPQILQFASSSTSGTPQPPSPVTLDSYNTVSGAHWSAQASGSISGNCAHYTDPGTGAAAVYTSTFTAKDITGRVSLTHFLGLATTQSYGYYGYGYRYGFDPGNISVGYIFHDSGGHTISVGTAFYQYESYDLLHPNWALVSVSIPQGVAGFNYAAVTSVTVTVTNYRGSQLQGTDVYFDELVASSATTPRPVISTRGAVYAMNVKGTAHAPLSVQVQQTGPAAEVGPASPASFAGGYLQLPCTHPVFSVAMTGAVLNLTGSSVFAKVSQVPQAGNGSAEAQFAAWYDANNYFMFVVYAGVMVAEIRQGGVTTDQATVPYTAAVGVYWRIREASGTVFWDVSTDTVTWVNLWSHSHTLGAKIQTMRAYFSCGYSGTENSPEPMLVGGINAA